MTERLHPRAKHRQLFEESLRASDLKESPRDKHGDPADLLRPSTMSFDGGWPPFGTIVPDQFKPAAKGVKGTIADSLSSAVFSSACLQGLSEEVMGVAMRKGLYAATVGTPALRGLSEEFMGVAMPKDLNSAIVGTSGWQSLHHAGSMMAFSKEASALFLKGQEIIKSCCMRLAQHSWFLDSQMPMSLLRHVADAFEEDPESTDDLLVLWFQERLDEIEEELVKACPKRALLLRSAFKAHREKDYNNSIPAFLKEADGMWHDMFGMNVFLVGARKSIAKTLEEKQQYRLVRSFVAPLLQSTLPLWMNESERHKWRKKHCVGSFPELNRHEVLHGISVDYGTETNSLKAISFLNWRLLLEHVVRDTL